MDSGPRWNPLSDGLGMKLSGRLWACVGMERAYRGLEASAHPRTCPAPSGLESRSASIAAMARRSELVSEQLQEYLVRHSTPADPVLAELADETVSRFPDAAGMQIGPEQGTFMTLLAQLTGARR